MSCTFCRLYEGRSRFSLVFQLSAEYIEGGAERSLVFQLLRMYRSGLKLSPVFQLLHVFQLLQSTRGRVRKLSCLPTCATRDKGAGRADFCENYPDDRKRRQWGGSGTMPSWRNQTESPFSARGCKNVKQAIEKLGRMRIPDTSNVLASATPAAVASAEI